MASERPRSAPIAGRTSIEPSTGKHGIATLDIDAEAKNEIAAPGYKRMSPPITERHVESVAIKMVESGSVESRFRFDPHEN